MPQQSRILIADSCQLMRWSLDQTLGTRYHVDEVCTGEEALAAMESRRYEVLILGCGCWDLTCRELTLRSKQIQPDLQIVLLGACPPTNRSAGAT